MASKTSGVVNIRGKEYLTVALRVSTFREQHPDWAILTELVSRDADSVVIKATIANEAGKVIGTGYAEENRNASQINRTSALENCETSAIGRALAACGYGGTEYASANEVENAIHQQRGNSVAAMALDGMQVDQEALDPHEMSLRSALAKGDAELAQDAVRDLDGDQKIALWQRFNSKERAALKGMLK